MSLHIDEHLATGSVPGPGSNILTGRYACYDVYRARDDKWLAVGAIEPQFFANLCKALALEEWIPYQNDDARQDELREAFRAAFSKRDRDDWVRELAPANTCVSPVYTVPELVEDPHFRTRGVWSEAEDREHGRFRQTGPVLAGGQREQPVHELRDPSRTDTVDLLRDSGIGDRDIQALLDAGAVE